MGEKLQGTRDVTGTWVRAHVQNLKTFFGQVRNLKPTKIGDIS